MPPSKSKARRSNGRDVEAYIATFPREAQVMMKRLRAAIKAAAPKAREKISYRIPFYEYQSSGYKGRMVYFGAFKNHVSLFVVPEKVPLSLAKQMKPYMAGRSTLQFPIGTKIPVTMIKQLVKIRMKEIDRRLRTQTRK